MPVETTSTAGVIRVVLGVARLGENDLRGWWQGHALNRTGGYVLSGAFPRTWRAAAMELDLSAAARMHDAMLWRADALHLFSALLPFRRWASAWLAEQKTPREPDPLLEELESWDIATATETMTNWCALDCSPTGEALGTGLLLGAIAAGELAEPTIIERVARVLASAYLSQSEPLRVPYVDLIR